MREVSAQGGRAADRDLARRPIAGLDLVRFAAALLVVLYHLGVSTWDPPAALTAKIVDGRAAYPELLRFGWSGFIGVEIFFVISGLVISYSAADSTAGNFLLSRIVRLYPAAWLCSAISSIVLLGFGIAVGDYLDGRKVIVLGFIHSVFLYPIGPWADAAYWTLGVEIVFYCAIFVLLLPGLGLTPFAYAMGTISAAYWVGGWLYAPAFLMENLWKRYLDLSLVHYGIYFSLGMLLYAIRFDCASPRRILFAVGLLLPIGIEILSKAKYNIAILLQDETAIVPMSIFSVALTCTIASLWWHAPSAIARPLRIMGLATYPLYLLHDEVGAVIIRTLVDVGANRFLALTAAVTTALAISILIAMVLEPPVKRWLRKVINSAKESQGAHNPR